MNKSTALSISALVAVMLACASTRMETITRITPEATRIRSYDLGESLEATTGSTMIRVGDAYVLPTFTPAARITPARSQDASPPHRLQDAPLKDAPPLEPLEPGQRWVATGRTSDGGYVLAHDGRLVQIDADGRIKGGPPDAAFVWPPDAAFVSHDDPALMEGSFEAELVYSGLDGSTLRLLYREYIDGLARPAFSQELTYNLEDSKAIEFKSLVIEVEDVAGSRIRFLVKEDGGLPWLPNR